MSIEYDADWQRERAEAEAADDLGDDGPVRYERCDECGGEGYVKVRRWPQRLRWDTCDRCDGSGEMIVEPNP